MRLTSCKRCLYAEYIRPLSFISIRTLYLNNSSFSPLTCIEYQIRFHRQITLIGLILIREYNKMQKALAVHVLFLIIIK